MRVPGASDIARELQENPLSKNTKIALGVGGAVVVLGAAYLLFRGAPGATGPGGATGSTGHTGPLVATEQDNGHTITLAVGDALSVELLTAQQDEWSLVTRAKPTLLTPG